MNSRFQLAELTQVSQAILDDFKTNVIRIDGAMGAGKTTLISSVCKQLGVKESVSSPTFSLVNCYQGTNGPIYHFDFYRLAHPDEALDFGIEEYFDSGHLCLLEWAEKITPHLPDHYDHYMLEVVDEQTRLLYTKNKKII